MGAHGRQLACLGRSSLALRLPIPPQGAEVIASRHWKHVADN